MSSKETKIDEPRINRQITAQTIRLVGANGEMVGVVPLREGLASAEIQGLDLVEVSPNAQPPVCKILDYGKWRYHEQKKLQEARKKQKIIQIKEVKLRPGIDVHDLGIKLKAVEKFLAEGDKVKFTLRFRGREMAHQDLGYKLLLKVRETLGDKIKVEHEPKAEGRQVIMVVSPAAKH
ncbi:MAG: translation initiation factor IF-3 [Azospirillum brasilense]|nr:MAG: translation initiation factor IF-3 [Azospirillum brasilense]